VPGPAPGALARPSRSPQCIRFAWGFCMGAQGAQRPALPSPAGQ
jgi:hypothetical protein